MNFWKRISSDSPKFFKKVMAIALSVAGTATALLALPESIIAFSSLVKQVLGYLVATGVVASVIAKTTVVNSAPVSVEIEEAKNELVETIEIAKEKIVEDNK